MNQQQLEKELRKLYKQMASDIKSKIEKQAAGFAQAEKAMQNKVTAGVITQREFVQWKRQELLHAQWAKTLYAELEEDISNAGETASNIINGSTAEAFADGYTAGLYEIEKGIKAKIVYGITGKKVYDQATINRLLTGNPNLLPIATGSKWGKRRLKNAVAQSIIKGEGIGGLAKRLTVITNMEGVSAIKNARTIMTSAQNGGRQLMAEEAVGMGIKMKKVWLATLDERTRKSHADADGQEVEIDDVFEVGESKLMFPADPNGDPAEVYNCRCTMIYNVNNNLESVDPANVQRYRR